MKRYIKIMVLGAGLILAASQARAQSVAFSIGVGGADGGFSFSYNSGAPMCVAPVRAVRVAPVVTCAPRVVHPVPRVVHARPIVRRHGHRRVEMVRAPTTRVYVVPTYRVAPHQPMIVTRCR